MYNMGLEFINGSIDRNFTDIFILLNSNFLFTIRSNNSKVFSLIIFDDDVLYCKFITFMVKYYCHNKMKVGGI